MKLADGIRRHGFRKWYERRLLSGHAHMVLTFLCAIGVLAAAEAFMTIPSAADRVFDAAALVLCGVVGAWAVRRYLFLLNHAEFVANQADCPACRAYGRMEVTGQDAAAQTVQVRCRKCGEHWTIQE